MANEAVLRYNEGAYGSPTQDYTIADAVGVEKGTVLELIDARTVRPVSTSGAAIAGIAAREKIASDGRTQISVYKKGYFDMYASGAIAIGQPVMALADSSNAVKVPTTALALSGAMILGYAEETATDKETVIVRLDL